MQSPVSDSLSYKVACDVDAVVSAPWRMGGKWYRKDCSQVRHHVSTTLVDC